MHVHTSQNISAKSAKSKSNLSNQWPVKVQIIVASNEGSLEECWLFIIYCREWWGVWSGDWTLSTFHISLASELYLPQICATPQDRLGVHFKKKSETLRSICFSCLWVFDVLILFNISTDFHFSPLLYPELSMSPTQGFDFKYWNDLRSIQLLKVWCVGMASSSEVAYCNQLITPRTGLLIIMNIIFIILEQKTLPVSSGG